MGIVERPQGVRTLRQRARHRREEPASYSSRFRARPRYSRRAVQALAWRALAEGGKRLGPHSIEWDLSGRCSRPYERLISGDARIKTVPRFVRGKREPAFMTVMVKTPCRLCESCIEDRQRLWTARALSECGGAPETLFGTLTLNPEVQAAILAECRELSAQDGVDFDCLTIERQFALRVARAGREVTKYIKRVREAMPSPILLGKRVPNLRYLLVAERHVSQGGEEDTRPHFHALFHVVHAAFPFEWQEVLHSKEPRLVPRCGLLHDQWEELGFAWWKRADSGTAYYICKYLSKDSYARVRASEDYGAFDYALVNRLFDSLPNTVGVNTPCPPNSHPQGEHLVFSESIGTVLPDGGA